MLMMVDVTGVYFSQWSIDEAIDQQAEIQQLQFIACGSATPIEPDSDGEQTMTYAMWTPDL